MRVLTPSSRPDRPLTLTLMLRTSTQPPLCYGIPLYWLRPNLEKTGPFQEAVGNLELFYSKMDSSYVPREGDRPDDQPRGSLGFSENPPKDTVVPPDGGKRSTSWGDGELCPQEGCGKSEAPRRENAKQSSPARRKGTPNGTENRLDGKPGTSNRVKSPVPTLTNPYRKIPASGKENVGRVDSRTPTLATNSAARNISQNPYQRTPRACYSGGGGRPAEKIATEEHGTGLLLPEEASKKSPLRNPYRSTKKREGGTGLPPSGSVNKSPLSGAYRSTPRAAVAVLRNPYRTDPSKNILRNPYQADPIKKSVDGKCGLRNNPYSTLKKTSPPPFRSGGDPYSSGKNNRSKATIAYEFSEELERKRPRIPAAESNF